MGTGHETSKLAGEFLWLQIKPKSTFSMGKISDRRAVRRDRMGYDEVDSWGLFNHGIDISKKCVTVWMNS